MGGHRAGRVYLSRRVRREVRRRRFRFVAGWVLGLVALGVLSSALGFVVGVLGGGW